LPDESRFDEPTPVLPRCSRYAVAPVSVVQSNVTEVLVNVLLGVGDVRAAFVSIATPAFFYHPQHNWRHGLIAF